MKAIHKAAPGLAPTVIAIGNAKRPPDSDDEDEDIDEEEVPYMVTTYIFLTPLSPVSSLALARRLASEMHAATSPTGKFGFECPTYCGVTLVQHGWQDTWSSLYKNMITGLLDGLREKGSYAEVCRLGMDVVDR